MPGFVVDGAKIINNVETTKGMGRKKERVAFEWLEACFGDWGDMLL